MGDQGFVGLALVFLLVGLFFWLAARLLARQVPAMQPASGSDHPEDGMLAAESSEAVMVVQAGGRVRSLNTRARQVFRLGEDEIPDLERLSRRARPPEMLLNLCAGAAQNRFVLDGRLVEGVSYRLDAPGDPQVLVALRFPELAGGLGQESLATAQTLQTFTELTQAMAASLDLEETLQAVLENVEKLIPADFMEITVWDAVTQVHVPYRFSGLPGIARRVEPAQSSYAANEGFSGYLYRERSPLMVGDVLTHREFTPSDKIPAGMRAYMGIPLLVGKEFIGTVEMGSRTPEAFREEDMSLVRLMSGQAAIAVHNAMLYEQEQRRSAELSGLAQLAQSFSSVRDPRELYARLVASISPLVQAEILGFLTYNENTRTLEAQSPFRGLPDPIVELYRVPILPGSPAEQTLLDQDVLLSEHAVDDEKWEAMGMGWLAKAASLRDTVLIPLASGGHMLGYLLVANHPAGKGFSQQELNLLMIVANQAASIIENASLLQQSRARAQRAEALRRIASLTSSVASLDEVLRYSVQELARLLKADLGVVFLVDSARTSLELHRDSFFGPENALTALETRLQLDDAQFPFTVTESQHTLRSGNISEEQAVVPFYRSLLEAWQVESLAAVPLVVRSEGIGEVWFGSLRRGFFDQADVQLVATAAGQLAGVVEQGFLRSQTDEGLRRRVEQLMAISRISRELSNTLDLSQLLRLIYEEAVRTSGADCGSVLFFDPLQPGDREPVVRSSYGDAHGEMLSELELRALSQRGVIRVDDFGGEGAPDAPHGGVRSAMLAAVNYQGRPAGLICLHSLSPSRFDNTAVEITQSLTVQAAVAIGNAVQFEDQSRRGALLKRELDTLTELLQVSQMLRPSRPLEESLVAIGGAIRQATPFQVNVISVVEPETQMLRRVVGAGLPPEQWDELRSHSQPWKSIAGLLQPEFRYGNVYYIPIDRSPAIPEDVYTITILPASSTRRADAWDPDDFLLVPLYDSGNQPIGLISVDVPSDGRRPDRPTYEALELFAIQAALMIENHRRVSLLEHQAGALEQERDRLRSATNAAQDNLPVLLHKDLEYSAALHALGRRIERVRAALEIAALANAQPGEEAMLDTLARELLTRFGMDNALVAERTPAGMRLTQTLGHLPAGVNPEALFGQRNPLRHLLQEEGGKPHAALLAASPDGFGDWKNSPLVNALEARSFIGLSMDAGRGVRTSVLVTGRRPLPAFSEEDRRIFEQLARQAAVGLQNARLLNETQRRLQEVNLLLEFGARLGTLRDEDILKVLVERVSAALPGAQAGWAGAWDEDSAGLAPRAAHGYGDDTALLSVRFRAANETDFEKVLPLRALRKGEPARAAELDFAGQYRLVGAELMSYRQATRGRLPVSCLSLPIPLGGKAAGVLMLENFETPGAFSAQDEALALSFTQQAGLALDNARLFAAAQQRTDQLRALTDAAGRLASILNPQELTASLLDLFKLVLNYRTATLWLREGEALHVAAARGFEDDAGRVGLTAAVEDSALLAEMIRTGQPLSVTDVRADPRFPALIEPENLSWLGIPLLAQNEVTGLIAVEQRDPGVYTPEMIQAAVTFASQAATALENARLYEESSRRASELSQRSQRLALLNRLSGELSGSLEEPVILRLASEQLLAALNASTVGALMIGPGGKFILESETPDAGHRLPIALLDAPLFDHLRETQGIFSTADVSAERDLAPLMEPVFLPRGTQSLLVTPLITGGKLHGWFLVQTDRTVRFSVAEIELARTVANQAAIAVQNARLFDETRSLTEFLEKRVEDRTGELKREHHNSQTLLRIIGELSTSLDMNQVLNRALAVVNESVGAQESLIYLMQGGQVYRAGEALAPAVEQVHVEREIARMVARNRKPILLNDLKEDDRWQIPEGQDPAYRSVLAVPLTMGEDSLGGLLLLHRETGFFQPNQTDLTLAIARQMGISLNNAELFGLIRDQSENLGQMLREKEIEASRSRAILEAVADGVLVTDDQLRMTLFNASAERILELHAGDVSGQPLDRFGGLFGRSGAGWMKTIRTWSQEPGSYQGETFADQFELDNGRVIAVHLAPVFWRQQFLGTVTIFRDITHEVQVDRLKSEFVANVSHELRTPMTSIKGYVEIMLMGATGDLSPQQRHFLEIVRSNTQRLSVLVNDLLDISRMESGRTTLNLQPVDLREVANDVIEDVQRRSREENKPMQFLFEAPDDLPQVRADLERIRQVLGNLVSNGYNYTPENGWVKVSIHSTGSEVQVDVEDNGIGIQPDEKHRVFERFYRGEDPLVLQTAGFGLGLAIARAVVGMHNGRIWFQSAGVRGKGSLFSFTLPVTNGESEG